MRNPRFFLRAAIPLLVAIGSGCRPSATGNGQRFSTLRQIDEQSVAHLGLAWSRELATTRGLEATPAVDDGLIFTTGSWSVVYAMDARTGEIRWTYNPKVAHERAYFICCDVVNRGVALHGGKVFVGTLDGRLVALDEHTGKVLWEVETVDTSKPYSITSAPCIAGNRVVIGNGGAEYGVRGSVSAFDADTGKLLWRFYTVPGDPANGFESQALAAAAKTWSGEWWKTGGGGTPWEGIIYDATLDLLYFGTGNPTAWYRDLRGAGDNLYTDSILAVRASTGELVWHFQPTPGDNWDYDATEPLVAARVKIGGRDRDALLQANKNGFFYVLDRATGEFLSGGPFVGGITWASGLDPKSGRPIEPPTAGSRFEASLDSPSSDGAHNWQPMAFSPATGLAYFAAKEGTVTLHAPDPHWKYDSSRDNEGDDESYDGPLMAKFGTVAHPHGELVAWNPAASQLAWRASYPVVEGGGTLATAGNLVFQGRADGILAAYRATDGMELWRFDAGTGIMAPPVTYTLDGDQYIAVMAGWGGPSGLFNGPLAGAVKPGYGRILTFRLGGSAVLHAPAYGHPSPPPDPGIAVDTAPRTIAEGRHLYGVWCARCHGWNAIAGPLPDLRYSGRETLLRLDDIVLHGTQSQWGMPSFENKLTAGEVRDIRAFLVFRARESAGGR
jgi:PQQ-dependent dehydrogenase (methanol/ethanol family)